MLEYVLPLEEGMLLLSDASNEIVFTEKDGVRNAVVTIYCSGSVQGTGGKENKKELEFLAEDYMNRMAANMQREKQVDLTGSYRKWESSFAAEERKKMPLCKDVNGSGTCCWE